MCSCTFPLVESLKLERSRSSDGWGGGRQVCWKSPNWLVWGVESLEGGEQQGLRRGIGDKLLPSRTLLAIYFWHAVYSEAPKTGVCCLTANIFSCLEKKMILFIKKQWDFSLAQSRQLNAQSLDLNRERSLWHDCFLNFLKIGEDQCCHIICFHCVEPGRPGGFYKSLVPAIAPHLPKPPLTFLPTHFQCLYPTKRKNDKWDGKWNALVCFFE